MPKTFSSKNPKTSFPAPRYTRVHDNERWKKAILFFEYWKALEEKPVEAGGTMADYVRVKIYRTWPVCNFQITEPERKDHIAFLIDGPIPFDPIDYRTWFLENYYSGSWNCWLLERAGEQEHKVMECFFDAVDLNTYPPRVDLRTVLWNHKANRELEQYYRTRNIPIPGDSEFKEQEEMTTGAALVQETLRGVTEEARAAREKNEELTRELVDAKIEAATKPSPGVGSMDAVATAVQGITQMVKDGAAVAIETSRLNAQNQARQVDGVGIFKDALEVAGKMNGQPETMMRMVLESAERQTAALVASNDKTLEYMRQRDQNAITAQKSGLDALIDEAPKLEQLGKLMGWSRRGGSADEPSKDSGTGWFGRVAEKIAENPAALASVTGVVNTGLQVVLALLGQKPAPAPTPVSAAPATVTPATTELKPEPHKPSEAEQVEQFLTFIETPFLHHFFGSEEGRNGETFARDFVAVVQNGDGTVDWNPGGQPTELGRGQYAILRQNGVQRLDKMLRSYQPIWSKVQGYSIQKTGEPVPKYYQFLQQFLNYGARMANA